MSERAWWEPDAPVVKESAVLYRPEVVEEEEVEEEAELEVEGVYEESAEEETREEAASVHELQLAAAIESLLFVSGRPLERSELRKLLDVSEGELKGALWALASLLDGQGRGVRLQRLGEQVQLVTAPENARYVAALLGLPLTAKLTAAALETLAVISYRQPITRAQIEAVRGVNSDRALASLIQHGLAIEVGRAPTVGRPALFATTNDFLQQFGLTSLEELPEVPESVSQPQPSLLGLLEQEEQ